MALAILQTEAYRRYDVSCVKVVELGCASFPPSAIPKLSAAFPAAHLANIYSLSEARYTGTAMIYDDRRPGSVGLPFGKSAVRITARTGEAAEPGAIGEICLRQSDLEPQHYFGDAEASAQVFGGGWTRTGDAGYLDEGGYLFVVDRIKDVIIKGGHNISTVAVENALLEHAAVAEAAVIGIPDALLGEDVVAALVTSGPADDRELRAFLRTRLGAHEMPSRFVRVTSLPRNMSGKVVKRELRDRVGAGENEDPAYRADRVCDADGAHSLAEIWASVLGRDTVEPDDDFFELGGNSIQASHITARVLRSLGVELPVTAVFENRTLAELSAVVDNLAQAGVAAAPPPIRRLPRPGQPA
jgi:acyl-CoA synthetase (AMP-forming)/AMP-acid ligase II